MGEGLRVDVYAHCPFCDKPSPTWETWIGHKQSCPKRWDVSPEQVKKTRFETRKKRR